MTLNNKIVTPMDCSTPKDFALYMFNILAYQLPKQGEEIISMDFSFEFSNLISNQYAAPVGFEKNILRNPNKPLAYKGWHGVVTTKLHEPLAMRFPEYYKNSLVYPTVVSNPKYWLPEDLTQTWGVDMFLDDWKHLELVAGLTGDELEGFYVQIRTDSKSE